MPYSNPITQNELQDLALYNPLHPRDGSPAEQYMPQAYFLVPPATQAGPVKWRLFDAAYITTGIIDPNRLGTGATGAGNLYLADDGTWKAVSGGGGGGAVDRIIAGTNISISPTGGTGVVTINATTLNPDPTGYGSFFSNQTQAISVINTPQVVTFNNTYEANDVYLSSNRIYFNKAGTYQFAYIAQVFNTANSIEHCSFWIRYNGNNFPNSATHITVNARKSSTEPSEQQMKLILSGTAQNDGDYIELYWQGTTTSLSLGYIAAGPGEAPVNSPSVIANIIPIGAQGRDSNLNELNDVTITSPVNNQLLRYNSGIWENWTPNFLTTVPTLDQVTTAGNTTTNEINIDRTFTSGVNNRIFYAGYSTTAGYNTPGYVQINQYYNSTRIGLFNKTSGSDIYQEDRAFGIITQNVGSITFTSRYHNYNTQLAGNYRWSNLGVESMRLESTGNLLIGTTTDGVYKLDVNGTARFGDLGNVYYMTLTSGGADGGILRVGGASYGYAELKSYALTLNGGHSLSGTGGVAQFALTSQVSPSAAQSNAAIKFVADNPGSGGGIWGAYSTALAFNFLKKEIGGTYTSILAMNGGSNNVGIGTTTPTEKLEINGNIKATSFIKSGGTSSQFLKADGSVDSNTYLTSLSGALPLVVGGSLNVNAANPTTLYTGSTGSWSNRGPAANNAGALLNINTHPGDFYSQLWFDTGAGSFYHRAASGSVPTGTWQRVYQDNYHPEADKLTTARQINGTNFDGTAAITTANWGTARTLTIGGTGKSVNGSGNVTWTLSEIQAEYRQPINTARTTLFDSTIRDIALFHATMTNKLRFVPATSQEESTDGINWTPSTRASSTVLADIMRGEGETATFNMIPSGTVGTYGGYRLTWAVNPQIGYVFFDHLYLFLATKGNNLNITIEKLHNTNGWEVVAGPSSVNNWPGHVSIPHSSIPYSASPTHALEVRITFDTIRSNTNTIELSAIEWFGAYPAQKRNVESYDRDKNATFPTGLRASNLLISGDTGIGTTTPASRLHVSGSQTTVALNTTTPTGVGLIVSNTDALYGTMVGTYSTGAGALQQRRTNSATYYDFYIQPHGGNVGIGNTAPSYKLDVTGTFRTTGKVILNNTTGNNRPLEVSSNEIVVADFRNTGSTSAYLDIISSGGSSTQMRLGVFGTNVGITRGGDNDPDIVINTSNNIGIGTITPQSRLHVEGAGVTYNLIAPTGNATFRMGDSVTGGTRKEFYIILDNTNNRVDIQAVQQGVANRNITINASGGNVGIGTTNPGAKLEVYGGNLTLKLPSYAGSARYGFGNPARIDDAAYIEYNGAGDFTGSLIFATNGSTSNVAATERMRITASGNVLIGTTTNSSYKLDVVGNIRTTTSSLLAGIVAQRNDTSENVIQITQATGAAAAHLYSRGDGYLGWIAVRDTGGTRRFAFESNPGIDSGSHFNLVMYDSAGTNSLTNWTATRTLFTVAQTFRTNTDTYLSATSGRVGIGISPAGAKLTVLGADETLDGAIAIQTPGATYLKLGGNSTYSWIQSFNSKPLYINALGNNVIFSGSGNVGIGTTNPIAPLQVVGTTIAFRATLANGDGGVISNDATISNFQALTGGNAARDIGISGKEVIFRSGTVYSESMRIFSSRNVAIGFTTDLGYKLHVEGTVNSTGYFANGIEGWTGDIIIATNPPGQQIIHVEKGIITSFT